MLQGYATTVTIPYFGNDVKLNRMDDFMSCLKKIGNVLQ